MTWRSNYGYNPVSSLDQAVVDDWEGLLLDQALVDDWRGLLLHLSVCFHDRRVLHRLQTYRHNTPRYDGAYVLYRRRH